MDVYRKSLIILKSLFNQSGNSHWAQWIETDIYEWDLRKSTSHHRGAFGGMGSINDQPIGTFSPEGCWQDALFDYVKNISWAYASKGRILVLEPPRATVDITCCDNCNYKEITIIEIERFLSKRHLPSLIHAYFERDDFEELLNIKQLIHTKEVEKGRVELKQNCSMSKITATTRQDRFKVCPDCGSPHFAISTLDVNSDQPLELKVRKAWWKRWFEILKG